MKGMGSLCQDNSIKSATTNSEFRGPSSLMSNQPESKNMQKMSTQPLRKILGNSNGAGTSHSDQSKQVLTTLPPKSIMQKNEHLRNTANRYAKHGSVTLTL